MAILGFQAICLAAYLPVTGPGPLRFRPAKPRVATVPVKAPAVGNDTGEKAETATTTATALTNTNTPAVVTISTNQVAMEAITNTVRSPSLTEEMAFLNSLTNLDQSAANGGPETGSLTPQMMLHFFQKDREGRRPSSVIAVPFSFIPPVPFAPPESKATFTTPDAN